MPPVMKGPDGQTHACREIVGLGCRAVRCSRGSRCYARRDAGAIKGGPASRGVLMASRKCPRPRQTGSTDPPIARPGVSAIRLPQGSRAGSMSRAIQKRCSYADGRSGRASKGAVVYRPVCKC